MHGPVLSERDLRYLWEHRRFTSSGLRTVGGEPVTVLAPGSPNPGAGPDFTGALIRIGPVLFRGDVEVHVCASDWAARGHHRDARYNGVILQVASCSSASPSLTASRRELPLLLLPATPEAQSAATLPPPQADPSSPPCPLTPSHDARALIRRLSLLGMQRLGEKRLRLEERLRDLAAVPGETRSGELWEQVLYEGVAEGLGYAKNREPLRALARRLTLASLRRIGLADLEGMLAALFGSAGLLPPPQQIGEEESRRAVQRLRARWKTLHLDISPLHEADWTVFHLRPVNLPTARLASLAFLLPQLFGPRALQSLVALFRYKDQSPASLLHALRQRFTIRPDAFWSRHLYFGTPQHPHGIALGRARADDIIVNTLLPWLLLYAGAAGQPRIEHLAILTYRTYPPLQRNRITCRAEHLLTGFPLASARLHQGALAWNCRYCRPGRCALCPILAQPPLPEGSPASSPHDARLGSGSLGA